MGQDAIALFEVSFSVPHSQATVEVIPYLSMIERKRSLAVRRRLCLNFYLHLTREKTTKCRSKGYTVHYHLTNNKMEIDRSFWSMYKNESLQLLHFLGEAP